MFVVAENAECDLVEESFKLITGALYLQRKVYFYIIKSVAAP